MHKTVYINKHVVLEGYGAVRDISLNAEWFEEQEKQLGVIGEVVEIKKGIGGIGGLFGSNGIKGCFVVFQSGAIICAQSDGEYIDVFCGRLHNYPEA
jgi:hypothetical protein